MDFEYIMLSSQREKEIFFVFSLVWNLKELNFRNREWEGIGEMGQRLKTSSYKMNTFQGSYVQNDDYSKQYCVIYLKFNERVDLKCYHHRNKKKKVF